MYPLLLYGLSFLFGILFEPIFLIPLSFVLYFAGKARIILSICVFITGYLWFISCHHHPGPGTYKGSGHLHVTDISKKTYYGKERFFYRGYLKNFSSEGANYLNIPVFFSLNEKAPYQNGDFCIDCTLIAKNKGFFLKPTPDGTWKKEKGTFSLAELRFEQKEKVKGWIKRSVKDESSASILSGLATGSFDDKALMTEFSKLGLSHLLAISGFHFTLLSSILSLVLKPFLSIKSRSVILILILGSYCFFLGMAPSILRAFITLLIFLLCPLVQAQSKAENSLGACLIVLLLMDPFCASSPGFILSFMATGAILVFYPLVELKMKKLFPARDRKTVFLLSKPEKIGLILLSFIRQSMSLNIAILIVMLPTSLALFHQFPPYSVLYNLFFPFLLSVSIILLIFSIFIPWLHPLNSHYTNFILQISKEAPIELSTIFYSKMFSLDFTVFIITIFFAIGLYKKGELKYN